MQWPAHFPDSCPPSDARPASGAVYRLTDHNPPHIRDFLSHRERQPDKVFPVPECQACGLSIYTLIEDVDRLRRRIPAMRKKFVAKGVLTSNLGKIASTPSRTEASHHTWWVPIDVKPWEVFHIITSSQDGRL